MVPNTTRQRLTRAASYLEVATTATHRDEPACRIDLRIDHLAQDVRPHLHWSFRDVALRDDGVAQHADTL